MQTVLKEAYNAQLLLRKPHLITVGSSGSQKDKVVITTENTYRHENKRFTFSHRIDVLIPCISRTEALKLMKALREYFDKDMMLNLDVGIFQKPEWLKRNQKFRTYHAESTNSGENILDSLEELSKNKDLKYVAGASAVESNVLANGFDLTYNISNFRLEHTIALEEKIKDMDRDYFKVKLYTESIFEDEDGLQEAELIVFEIEGDSENEVNLLGDKLYDLSFNKDFVLTCKGRFPTEAKDFYTIKLDKKIADILKTLPKAETKKAS